MTLEELKENLEESLDSFNMQSIHHVARKQGETLNEFDYDEICRQFSYVMYDFKEYIIEYLKFQEK